MEILLYKIENGSLARPDLIGCDIYDVVKIFYIHPIEYKYLLYKEIIERDAKARSSGSQAEIDLSYTRQLFTTRGWRIVVCIEGIWEELRTTTFPDIPKTNQSLSHDLNQMIMQRLLPDSYDKTPVARAKMLEIWVDFFINNHVMISHLKEKIQSENSPFWD